MNFTSTIARAELEPYEKLLAEAGSIHSDSLARAGWRRLRRNRPAMACLVFLVAMGFLALVTPLLPLESPSQVDTSRAFEPPTLWPLMVRANVKVDPTAVLAKPGDTPSAPNPDAAADDAAVRAEFLNQFGVQNMIAGAMIRARVALFGTWCVNSLCGRDELGRDQLTRLLWGARVSLAVGIVATLVSLVIGVSYGAISGYVGGAIDNLMMRIVEVFYSIPFVFVVIFLITILSEDSIKTKLENWGINRITVFFIVVGAIYWLTMARVVRGQVLSLKHEQFVEAARTIGASGPRIIFLHIVPNLLSVVIVYLTLTIPRVMLFEAFLSFLGLGVQPPDVSWGLLANQGFRVISPVKIYWWLFVWPSLALGSTLLALNFLGDGLRDALDPRLKTHD